MPSAPRRAAGAAGQEGRHNALAPFLDRTSAIGSTNVTPPGYFIITNEAELAASVRHLETRAAAILDRAQRLRGAAAV